jgi:hypothetical protein
LLAELKRSGRRIAAVVGVVEFWLIQRYTIMNIRFVRLIIDCVNKILKRIAYRDREYTTECCGESRPPKTKIRVCADNYPLRGWSTVFEIRKLSIESGGGVRGIGNTVEEFGHLGWGPIVGILVGHWRCVDVRIDNQV